MAPDASGNAAPRGGDVGRWSGCKKHDVKSDIMIYTRRRCGKTMCVSPTGAGHPAAGPSRYWIFRVALRTPKATVPASPCARATVRRRKKKKKNYKCTVQRGRARDDAKEPNERDVPVFCRVSVALYDFLCYAMSARSSMYNAPSSTAREGIISHAKAEKRCDGGEVSPV